MPRDQVVVMQTEIKWHTLSWSSLVNESTVAGSDKITGMATLLPRQETSSLHKKIDMKFKYCYWQKLLRFIKY